MTKSENTPLPMQPSRFTSFVRLIISTWIVMILPGCLILKQPRYPKDWPVPDYSQNIPSFSGEFCSELFELLQKNELPETCSPSGTVSLRVDSSFGVWMRKKDSSSVASAVEQKLPLPSSIFNIKIKKNPKGIRFTYRSRNNAGNPILGINRIYNQIFPLADGSLLIKSDEFSFGLVFLLLPFYAHEYCWIRMTKDVVQIKRKLPKRARPK